MEGVSGSRPSERAVREIEAIVGWYLDQAYGQSEGPGLTPFFGDAARVGAFAVDLDRLRRRDDAALFRLLVLMSLYQSRRDVDIMAIQRTMARGAATALTSTTKLQVLVEDGRCDRLRSASAFKSKAKLENNASAICANFKTNTRTIASPWNVPRRSPRRNPVGRP